VAIVIGVGAFELGMLAAGCLIAIYLATPQGQKQTKEAIDRVVKSVTRDDPETTVTPDVTTDCPDKTKEKEKEKECDPCPPCPAPPPPRTDIVPPSRPHKPCPGSHTHIFFYESNQNPKTCECFCNLKERVECI
jgi:hypothetical protein